MPSEHEFGLDALERREQQNAQHQGVQRHVAPGLGAADRRQAGYRRRQGGHQEVQQPGDMVTDDPVAARTPVHVRARRLPSRATFAPRAQPHPLVTA